MANTYYKSKPWLHKRYVIDKKSLRDIARECGCSVETVYLYVKKFQLGRYKK